MTLCEGDTIRLITVDLAEITYRDWLSFREAAPGDIAQVLHLYDSPSGRSLQLVCGPPPGNFEWGATFKEQGFTFEVVSRKVDEI
ncbi:hypothetical protein PF70_04020 [Pseudomonas asplenii]|nr:hypothetical protein PF70_04020 [Pseudomonas fuscovaginae]